MKITTLNIRHGGSKKRNPLIIDYLLTKNSDLIILTEFINNENGKQIIKQLGSRGYQTQASNPDGGHGSFIASKENFNLINIDNR